MSRTIDIRDVRRLDKIVRAKADSLVRDLDGKADVMTIRDVNGMLAIRVVLISASGVFMKRYNILCFVLLIGITLCGCQSHPAETSKTKQQLDQTDYESDDDFELHYLENPLQKK